MTERIRELAKESGAWEYYEINEGVNDDETPLLKFAELIVRECGRVLEDNELGGYRVDYVLREHFSVDKD